MPEHTHGEWEKRKQDEKRYRFERTLSVHTVKSTFAASRQKEVPLRWRAKMKGCRSTSSLAPTLKPISTQSGQFRLQAKHSHSNSKTNLQLWIPSQQVLAFTNRLPVHAAALTPRDASMKRRIFSLSASLCSRSYYSRSKCQPHNV